MVKMQTYLTEESWLVGRGKTIGGSEAAALAGMSSTISSSELWEIKTGRASGKDLSDNLLVQYGKDAEKYLRGLFVLDFPVYKVDYQPFNIWRNSDFPFAHASLDGWLKDKEFDRFGILEIKTATIKSAVQKAKWDNRIPDNYYCQLCWYMGVCEADFAILKAQLKYEGDMPWSITKHYYFERAEMQEDIDYLLEKGKEFWENMIAGRRPPLVLPKV